MYTRFTEKIKQKESRRFFVVYLTGKMIGLSVAIAAVWVIAPFLHNVAGAQTSTEGPPITDVVNATNTAWVLVTAFLVFFMQAGFMMLEAGFARTREVVNVLQECIVDTCLCGLLFWAFGASAAGWSRTPTWSPCRRLWGP